MTIAVGGGNDVMIACWNDWRLSASLSSPQALCNELLLCDQGDDGVVSCPIVWDVLDEGFYVVVVCG